MFVNICVYIYALYINMCICIYTYLYMYVFIYINVYIKHIFFSRDWLGDKNGLEHQGEHHIQETENSPPT